MEYEARRLRVGSSMTALPKATSWIRTATPKERRTSRQSRLVPLSYPASRVHRSPVKTLKRRTWEARDISPGKEACLNVVEVDQSLQGTADRASRDLPNAVLPDSQSANEVGFNEKGDDDHRVLSSQTSSPVMLLKRNVSVRDAAVSQDIIMSETKCDSGTVDIDPELADLPCTESALRSTQSLSSSVEETTSRPFDGQSFALSPLSGWARDNDSLLDCCRTICGIPDGQSRTKEERKARSKMEEARLKERYRHVVNGPSYVRGAGDHDSWTAFIRDSSTKASPRVVNAVARHEEVSASAPEAHSTTPFYWIATSRRSPTPPRTNLAPIYIKGGVQTPSRSVAPSSVLTIPSSRTPKPIRLPRHLEKSAPVSPTPCRRNP